MDITIDGRTLRADMVDNQATAQLKALLADGCITVNLHEYGGFERVGSLPRNLTTSDRSINVATGDIVLYLGNQIVFMLGSNSWSYTPLGHIDADRATLESFFGPGNSTATLSLSDPSAVDKVEADHAAVEYYDLLGRNATAHSRGVIVKKTGSKATKNYK